MCVHDTRTCDAQFLESYKSVTLESMAQSFGVTPEFIDRALVDFIVAGRLTAKIDKVAGVIETNRYSWPQPANGNVTVGLV